MDRATKVLADWRKFVPKFVKVMPKDYQRVLESMKKVKEKGLTGDEAVMAAFEENVRDVARVAEDDAAKARTSECRKKSEIRNVEFQAPSIDACCFRISSFGLLSSICPLSFGFCNPGDKVAY